MFQLYGHHQVENILMDSLTFEENGEWKLYTEAKTSRITATIVYQPTQLDIKDDHYDVSDIIKQWI
jgi:hypothetical protein